MSTGCCRLVVAMSAGTLLFGPFSVPASAANVNQKGEVSLSLPRIAKPDEAVWLELRAGVLAPRAKLRIRSSDGMLILPVAPSAVPAGQAAGTFLVPLPPKLVVGGKVELRVEVQEPGSPARAPTQSEIEDLVLILVPISR